MGKRVIVILLVVAAAICILFVRPKKSGEPRVIWEKSVPADWASKPTIGNDGTIYFGDLNYNLCAVRPNGTFRWKSALPSKASIDATAIGADGAIYCVTRLGEIAAFGANGTFMWAANLDAPTFSAPAIGPDGCVYVGSKSNRFYAFNPDGSQRWEFKTTGWESGNAAIGLDGTIYFQCRKNVYALDTNGIVKWTFTDETASLNHPIVGPDGTIYVATFTNFCAINPEGAIKWRIGLSTGQHSAILDRSGTLYVCAHDGLMALHAATGKLIRKYPQVPFPFCGLALGKDGTIYFSGTDSSIDAIDQSAKLKWRFTRDRYVSPGDVLNRLSNWLYGRFKGLKGGYGCGFTLTEDGRMYAIMPDRKLYALEVSSGLDTNAPWPMLKHDVQHSGRAAATSR